MNKNLTKEGLVRVLADEEAAFNGLLQKPLNRPMKARDLVGQRVDVTNKCKGIVHGTSEIDDLLVCFEYVLDGLIGHQIDHIWYWGSTHRV